ncbi:hypothetical protein ACW7G2_11955 [Luteimonas sp. A277]
MSSEAQARRLLDLLDHDELDAAIDAGLANFEAADCALPPADQERLQAARERRLQAWAARARHQARNARLARRAETLRQRRAAAAPSINRPGLPATAAAALERARQRARGTGN